jgi:hypothetical protein
MMHTETLESTKKQARKTLGKQVKLSSANGAYYSAVHERMSFLECVRYSQQNNLKCSLLKILGHHITTTC